MAGDHLGKKGSQWMGVGKESESMGLGGSGAGRWRKPGRKALAAAAGSCSLRAGLGAFSDVSRAQPIQAAAVLHLGPCWVLRQDAAASGGPAPPPRDPGWSSLGAEGSQPPRPEGSLLPRRHSECLSDLDFYPQGLSLFKPASPNRADVLEKKEGRGSHDEQGAPVPLVRQGSWGLLRVLEDSFPTER